MAAPQTAPQTSFFEPVVEEVVAAAHSLYDDELKPFGRILLKRIRERAALPSADGSPAQFPDAESVPLIDPKSLRRLCESSPSLFNIEPAEGREYAVTLFDRPAVFVDATSHVDPYPASLWVEASSYFEALEGEASRMPCGRYSCAQVLQARGLAFLQGRSLGELCHIVQLAISQKRILGYLDGHTVPYGHSEECAKQRCAVQQQPFGEAQITNVGEPFASWEDLRVGLRLILENSCNPAPGVITLSNVKRLFRSQLHLEVSETVLGHSKVCELLQDPRLHDICTVQVLGCGQALVALVERPAPPVDQFVPLCTAPPALPASPSHSSCASTRTVTGFLPGVQQVAPVTMLSMPAASWVPVLVPKARDLWDAVTLGSYAESETDAGWTSGSSLDDLETRSSGSLRDCGDLADSDSEEVLPAAFMGAGFVVRNTFIDMESPTASASRRSQSVPRSLRVPRL